MIDKLTEEQRKVLIIWVFLGIFLAILLFIFAHNRGKYKSDYKLDKEYTIVNDYSRYYTITNILDKFYNAFNDKKYDMVMNMLDSNYVKANNIDVNNVSNILKYDKRVSFRGNIMCKKTFDKGYTSYYVSGTVIGTNVEKDFDNVYYEVILNENEMTFSINILDASKFGGVCHV